MEIVNVFSLSDEEKKAFINKYQQFYYKKESYSEDEKSLLGQVLKNKTEESVEEYADKVLSKELGIDKRIFLWKAGRLTPVQAAIKDIQEIEVLNGRGCKIEKAKEFIDSVKADKEMDFSKGIAGFEQNYKKLLDLAKQTELKNVGAVYLISVLFFLSDKKYPIYDYFAHRAVKALFLGKAPVEIFVGGAPDKTEVDKVVAMYKEYVCLLEWVFGKSDIERELDRALWVYGHSTKQWKYGEEEIGEKEDVR